jgi:hypothetical protein
VAWPTLKVGQDWKVGNEALARPVKRGDYDGPRSGPVLAERGQSLPSARTVLTLFNFDTSNFPLDVAGGAIVPSYVQFLEWARGFTTRIKLINGNSFLLQQSIKLIQGNSKIDPSFARISWQSHDSSIFAWGAHSAVRSTVRLRTSNY